MAQGLLRTALGVVLIGAGVALLSKADTDLVPWALAVSALVFVGLFAAQALIRREVEQDPDEQEAIRRAIEAVAVTGDDIMVDPGVSETRAPR